MTIGKKLFAGFFAVLFLLGASAKIKNIPFNEALEN